MALILALETSCDETGAAVVDTDKNVLSNVVASQIEFHREFGGVVPEIAARKHVETINFVVESALKKAGVSFFDIDYFAATQGPGLIGALLIGMTTAKAYAFALKKPVVFVDHIEAHIWANFLNGSRPPLPAVSLVVSGGHTSFFYLNENLELRLLGETIDDAVGEAFDKVAKLLSLPYPGGPEIEKAAEKSRNPVWFVRPYIDSGDFNFSFSGIKTAVLYYLKKNPDALVEDVARGFQEAVVDVLIAKTKQVVDAYPVKSLLLAGGVVANRFLRKRFEEMKEEIGIHISFPQFEYCTDNAAMIGGRAADAISKGQIGDYTTPAYSTARIRV